MQEVRHGLWPFLMVCLLVAWPCCQGLTAASLGVGCNSNSEYLTVADTTGYRIAGCYRKTDGNENGGPLYINTDGGAVDGGKGRATAVWPRDNQARDSRWAIGEVGGGHAASKFCVSGALMQDWHCANGAVVQDLVSCGCEPDMMGKIGGAGVSEAVRGSSGGSSSSSKSKTRHSMRGVDGNGNGSGKGEEFAVAAAEGGAVVSRALEDTGDFHGFWRWVIIAGALAGLIVLCCVGWYIRNPFFCQKDPPADPSAQPEDAAPQAPKTAFQPWGASAPPK